MKNPLVYSAALALNFSLLSFFGFPMAARPDSASDDRKRAARQIYADITKLPLHRVYVPDFVDSSGKRSPLAYYLAATFSQALVDDAKEVGILSRVEAHKYLGKSGWTDGDLADREVLAKFAAEFSLDGILSGSLTTEQKFYTIDFSVHDLAGKELLRGQYRHDIDLGIRGVILSANYDSGPDFVFAGIDGVSAPKCKHCPPPRLPSPKAHSGVVSLSAVIGPAGKPERIYVVQTDDLNLDESAVEAVKLWRLEPSRNSEGVAVPARVWIEVHYRFN